MQVTREQLDRLIEDNDWTAVEQADVSEITDMSGLFKYRNGIENLDLSGWDTKNVTDMSHMFYNSDFNHPLDSFGTSNVTAMMSMFSYSKFNHPLDSFDTSKVTDMRFMFRGSNFNHPLDSFDTSSVTNMSHMFLNCKYTKPMPWAENISLDTKGAEEIVERYERNRQWAAFLNTGKGELDILLNSFEDDDEILSQIKLAALKLNQHSSPVSVPSKQGQVRF